MWEWQAAATCPALRRHRPDLVQRQYAPSMWRTVSTAKVDQAGAYVSSRNRHARAPSLLRCPACAIPVGHDQHQGLPDYWVLTRLGDPREGNRRLKGCRRSLPCSARPVSSSRCRFGGHGLCLVRGWDAHSSTVDSWHRSRWLWIADWAPIPFRQRGLREVRPGASLRAMDLSLERLYIRYAFDRMGS